MNKPHPQQSTTVITQPVPTVARLLWSFLVSPGLSWSLLLSLGRSQFLLLSPHPQTRRQELYISRSIFTCSSTFDFNLSKVLQMCRIN